MMNFNSNIFLNRIFVKMNSVEYSAVVGPHKKPNYGQKCFGQIFDNRPARVQKSFTQKKHYVFDNS